MGKGVPLWGGGCGAALFAEDNSGLGGFGVKGLAGVRGERRRWSPR